MFATLAADEVQVTFRETAALDQSAIGAAADLLSEEERTRCARFMFARDRRDFAIAHALLRQTLSRHHPIPPREWTFVPEPHGKPRISADLTTAADLHFNIAHTHGLVACAVSRGADVGIDVEEIERRSDPLEIASRYFSVIETEDLKRCAPDDRFERFTEIWTLKEAYIKAIGKGLSLPLDEFAFRFEDPSALRFTAATCEATAWSFALFAPTHGHRMAVAARRVGTQVRPRIILQSDAVGRLDDGAPPVRLLPGQRARRRAGHRRHR